ncbi:uncharacterized protein LOC116187181 isoform X2 [Punica granatum]|uniref:Uncharacterized protein LOC116187181 isoform X2 n=2 Tax=Punica granatum TaxID=22663 RepID=A0A6P8BMZ6_PUNGR|nr:uncharacterized protein LOC116187181 isoform X2 [Punica granatum]
MLTRKDPLVSREAYLKSRVEATQVPAAGKANIKTEMTARQSSGSRMMMKPKLLLLLLLASAVPLHASSSSPCAPESDFDSNTGYSSEWKILRKHNFSSQIRIHPHILLLVTLPWSGESRALMRDVALAVKRRKPEFSSLKLMVMYRTTEKMLADAIGATDEITILYFHHSKSYKYQGRLRAQNILSSVHPHLFLPPEDVPLKHLTSPLELRAFLDSTDKALLLLEFCGWTPELQRRGRKNVTEHGFIAQGLGGNANPTLVHGWNDDQKGMDSSMQCSIAGEVNGIPWLGEFGSVTDAASWGSEEARLNTGYSCNFQEFQLFESFFLTFMTVARELFLPPERHRFGLVAERSLLPFLGVEEPKSWSLMIHYAGCPSCSKMLREVDDFKSSMQIDNSIVAELEGSGHTQEPALPANKASMLLFVDRSSELSEDRVKSREALNALRDLAWHLQISYHGKKHGKLGSFAALSHQSQESSFRRPNVKQSALSQNFKTKDKMSITIINEEKEKHVSLDTGSHKNSLHEILEHLQQTKEGKLSLLAKKVGFQLLSDDLEIKIASLSSNREDQPIQAPPQLSQEGPTSDIHQHEEQVLNGRTAFSAQNGDTSATVDEEKSKLMDPEPSQYDEERGSSLGRSKKMAFAESGRFTAKGACVNSEDSILEKTYSLKVDKLKDKELHIEGFRGSFHFCDGDYRLLRTLTGDSKIPSLVIVDPVLQQHYIYPAQKKFTFAALAQFLRGYLNASLLPYQQSESTLPIPKEVTRPPFVNLDFYEADPIPKITARSISEMIFGINQSLVESVSPHPQKDVFVLFSNNWCGFCQRMELVVREVHRALKGYMKILETGFEYEKMPFIRDSLENISVKLPFIYLLDCTINDCSFIFKTIKKGEVYPALVLFPAGSRTPISYEGETAVSSVINFMAEHGSNIRHLINENGILWTRAGKEGSGSRTYFDHRSADAVRIENPTLKDRFHEVIANAIPERISSHKHGAESVDSKGVQEVGAAQNVVVGTILAATKNLAGAHHFDESMILIVKADREAGFQGLIINKHISWDSLRELDGGSEVLREAHLSFGGPLAVRGLPLVALTRRAAKDQFPEVLPGIYFVDQFGTVGEIEELKSGTARSVTDYWFFLGYVSWSWDQLFDEIAEGSWAMSRDDDLEWPSG